MKLTKEQITYIDDYLKHHKVKYWDIRIELLDHIVTNVEALMDKGISFDDAMIEVHKSFGNKMTMFWNSGIEYGIFTNGLGYKSLIEDRGLEINNKYRKLFWKEVGLFFQSLKMNCILLSFLVIELLLFNNLDISYFTGVNLFLFLTPILFFFGFSFRNYKMKKNSIHMRTSITNVLFPFLILQGGLQFIKEGGIFNISEENAAIILVIITTLNLIFTHCGFIVYRKAETFYTDVFNKLKSL